jgi:peptidoglycan/xylan/chitin deacetylase (PgdA/CDA1 family)
MTKVTTSWDDGDILDTRVAELLDLYGLKGTFYITKKYRKDRVSEEEIRDISLKHEIGAHTLSHPDLRKISPQEKKNEIGGSKEWLEGVLGHEVPMFCYPSGRLDDESVRIVQESGYRGARTTELGQISYTNPHTMSTTLSVYPMPLRKIDAGALYWRHLFETLQQRGPVYRKLGIRYLDMRSFEALACRAFDIAKESNGIYHLWGHSWEVEKFGMWEELERVFKYISDRSDCTYVTNGELV